MSAEKIQLLENSIISTIIDVYAQKGTDYSAQINFTKEGVKVKIIPATPQEDNKNKYTLTEEEVNDLFSNL